MKIGIPERKCHSGYRTVDNALLEDAKALEAEANRSGRAERLSVGCAVQDANKHLVCDT